MSQGRRCGRPLTLSEHAEIAQWNRACGDGWPRIELALNYPETPEMFGVVERGQVGPTLFLWLTERGAVTPYGDGRLFWSLADGCRSARCDSVN